MGIKEWKGNNMKAPLVRVVKCYSGLLGPEGSKYRRIAIATPRAIEVFDQHPAVQNAVISPGRADIHFMQALYENGLEIQTYHSIYQERELIHVGMLITRPANYQEEYAMYSEARKMLSSLEEGIHRRVFFKTKGVETTEELADLPPNLYSALLAKIKTQYDPEMRNIGHISVADSPLDWIGTLPDGAKMIVFSRSMLARARFWSSIEENSGND